MLVITPIQDMGTQDNLCSMCSVTPRPGCLCYQAHDRKTPEASEGTFLGVCQFDIGSCGTIYDLKNAEGVEDEEALFIMGRQTLNFIDLCGVHHAVLDAQSSITEHLIRWLGFRKNGDCWEMNLEGFFADPCKHTEQHT